MGSTINGVGVVDFRFFSRVGRARFLCPTHRGTELSGNKKRCPTYVLLRSVGSDLTFQHLSVDLKFEVIQAIARSKPKKMGSNKKMEKNGVRSCKVTKRKKMGSGLAKSQKEKNGVRKKWGQVLQSQKKWGQVLQNHIEKNGVMKKMGSKKWGQKKWGQVLQNHIEKNGVMKKMGSEKNGVKKKMGSGLAKSHCSISAVLGTDHVF